MIASTPHSFALDIFVILLSARGLVELDRQPTHIERRANSFIYKLQSGIVDSDTP
jgi:hypothetical protein